MAHRKLRLATCATLRAEIMAVLSSLSLKCGQVPNLRWLQYQAVRFGWRDSGVRPDPTADLVKIYSPWCRHVVLPIDSPALLEALPPLWPCRP